MERMGEVMREDFNRFKVVVRGRVLEAADRADGLESLNGSQ